MDPQEAREIIGEIKQFCDEEVNQCENRLEVTNQVTERRLENRLEATNQVIGCRLQVAGSKTIELPRSKWSSDRIKTALGIYCDHCLISIIENECLSTYADKVLSCGADPQCVEDFKEYWNKAHESLDAGDYPLAMSWIQLVEDLQQAIEYSIKKNRAFHTNNWELLKACHDTVREIRTMVGYKDQYIQASTPCPTSTSAEWKRIVEQLQSIVDDFIKATESDPLKNEQEYNYCREPNDFINNMKFQCSVALKKTTQARKANREEFAILWFEMAKLYERFVFQAISAGLSGHTDNYEIFDRNEASGQSRYTDQLEQELFRMEMVANNNTTPGDLFPLFFAFLDRFENTVRFAGYRAILFISAARALGNASKTQAANQGDIAALWCTTSKRCQELAEYYRQAERVLTHGNSIECKRVLKADMFANSSIHQLKELTPSLEKASQAIEANQEELALLWHKKGEHNQKAAECCCKEANVRLSGDATGRECFYEAGLFAMSADQLNAAIKALEHASKAAIAHQEEQSALWLEIARRNQESAEYYSPIVRDAVKETSGKACFAFRNKTGTFAKISADQLRLAAIALEKAFQVAATDQGELASLWRKTAEQNQKVAEYYYQAAKAVRRDGVIQRVHCREAKEAVICADERLELAFRALQEVSRFTETNQGACALFRCKIAEQSQQSADYYCQAVKAAISDNEGEQARYVDFKNAGDFAKSSTTQLESVAAILKEAIRETSQVTEANQQRMLWNESVERYQKSADLYQQVAEAYASGNTTDAERLVGIAEDAKGRAEWMKRLARDRDHNPRNVDRK